MLSMLGAMLEGTVVSLEVFFLTLILAIPLALPVALGYFPTTEMSEPNHCVVSLARVPSLAMASS